MASAAARGLWAEMKKDPANKICVECGGNDPTWASVSYGNLFCLECSGVHRSLGVHISFVRSLGMDKWSDEQMQFMKCGGNAKCKKFFKKHGIPESMSIIDRYHTEVASSYKAKLKSLVNGDHYSEPAVGSLSTVPNRPERRQMGISNSQSSQKKYTGMGNYTPPKKSEDEGDWGTFLSSGMATLSTVASVAAATTTQYAKTAAEKLTETSAELAEKAGQTNWSETATALGSTVAETSNTGWSTLSSYWQTAREYTTQAIAGEPASRPSQKSESLDEGWVNVSNDKKKDEEWDSWGETKEETPAEKTKKVQPETKSRLSLVAEELSDNEVVHDDWTESKKQQSVQNDGWNDAAESDGDEWESWS